jgi:hypothetical protein
MGYAVITGGGTDGRYDIELDFGESTRVALLNTANAVLVALDAKIVAAQEKVTTAKGLEAAQQAKVDAAYLDLQAKMNNLAPGSPVPDTAAYTAELKALRQLEFKTKPFSTILESLKRSKAELQRKISDFIQLQTTRQAEAWCADLTENAPQGMAIATLEIPGEDNLILLAPGGRFWQPSDGVLRARELMSPEQAYFNASILPGWQKFKPTYRWGTITAINRDTQRATVNLPGTTSSAQRLNVDQEAVLQNVPFQYMTCGHAAFENGDNVVVEFTGQDWAAQKIIGFLDNPKACGPQFIGGGPFIYPAVQLQVGIPMRLQQALYLSGDSYEFTYAYTESLNDCFTGGQPPYSYAFIDGDAPPGVGFEPITGKFSGTLAAGFETRTLKIRCFDSRYVEGENVLYADSSPIEFSSGELTFIDSESSIDVNWYNDGSLYVSGAEVGRWHTGGDSAWADANLPTLADAVMPRYQGYCTLISPAKADALHASYDDGQVTIDHSEVWLPLSVSFPSSGITSNIRWFPLPLNGSNTFNVQIGYYDLSNENDIYAATAIGAVSITINSID